MSSPAVAQTQVGPREVGVGLRLLRAAYLATAASVLAVGAHVLGGGVLPGRALLGTLVVLVAWPLALGLGRRASAGKILGLLLGAQTVIHAGLTLAAQGSSSAPGALPGVLTDPSAMHHGARELSTSVTAGSTGIAPTGMNGSMSPADLLPFQLWDGVDARMLTAHLLGTGLMWWWLNSAEKALFGLLHLARRSVVVVLATTLARLRTAILVLAAATETSRDLAGTSTLAGVAPTRPFCLDVGRHVIARRGPPRARPI